MRCSVLLLLFFCACIHMITFGQESRRIYQQYVNHDSSFVSICSKMEASLIEEKQKVLTGDAKDNDYIKFKRWETYWRERLTEEGKLPQNELLDAGIDLKMKQKSGQNKSLVVWEFKGPSSNTGGFWGAGRVTDIAFHPTNQSIFFVATAKGGIWKTTDGGSSYFSIGDDLPYNSVGNIVINQANPNEIYITLGDNYQWTDYGLGVYKTIDGGATWFPTQLAFSLASYVTFYEMKGSPHTENLLLVSTGIGLFRSTDGNTFSLVSNGLPNTVNSGSTPGQIVFHPTNPSIIYLSWWDYTGANLDLFKSTDAGLSWSNVTNFDFNTNGFYGLSISTTASNPSKVVVQAVSGSDKRIYYSNDEGNTWTAQPINPILENSPICISPNDQNLIYSGFFYVKRSYDNGYSFENFAAWDLNFVHVDQQVIVINPLTQELYWGNDGGVYKYSENQQEWTELNNGLTIRQIYRTAVGQNQNDVYYFGSQDNGGGYYSPSTGWVNGNGGDAMNNAIDPTASNIVYSTYPLGLGFYKTVDSWTTHVMLQDSIPNYAGNADWLSPFDLATDSTSILVSASSEIFMSKDQGDNWMMLTNNELSGNKIRDIRFSPSNWQSIYGVTNNAIIESNDGGNNWFVHNFGSGNLTRVFPHPSEEDKLWLIKSGYTAGEKIFFSSDRGQTFTNISGMLPNIPVLSFVYDSVENQMFLGTELGVYKSEEGLMNWELHGQGMPNTMVFDLDIQQTQRKLIASTYGRGIWQIDLYDFSNESSSIGEQNDVIALNIFPNPVENELKITFSSPVNGHLKIYNSAGQQMSNYFVKGNTVTINLHSVSSGIYTAYLTNLEGENICFRKFIKI